MWRHRGVGFLNRIVVLDWYLEGLRGNCGSRNGVGSENNRERGDKWIDARNACRNKNIIPTYKVYMDIYVCFYTGISSGRTNVHVKNVWNNTNRYPCISLSPFLDPPKQWDKSWVGQKLHSKGIPKFNPLDLNLKQLQFKPLLGWSPRGFPMQSANPSFESIWRSYHLFVAWGVAWSCPDYIKYPNSKLPVWGTGSL